MPKMMNNDDQFQTKGPASFTFSGVRADQLSETEYTLATIVVDITGSVGGFENDLLKALKTSVESCKKSPRANNLLVRVCEFNSQIGVKEIHGFRLLSDINVDDYELGITTGGTPLFDATFNGIKATVDYGVTLVDQDFNVNGIVFIITDGDDNASKTTPGMIKKEIEDSVKGEKVESLTTVLVGIDTSICAGYLNDFKNNAGLTQYVDIGSATPQRLAKLGGFVSKSISSTSQALGTGKSAPVQSLVI
jgi:hypothetical protein